MEAGDLLFIWFTFFLYYLIKKIAMQARVVYIVRIMRIAINLSYEGHNYSGWQRQLSQPSVQGYVETALSKVADHKVEITCAGRTDAGVHATDQVVHFDTDSERELHNWVMGANANLPDDIAVSWAAAVKEDFHARFAATARRYWYVIYNRATRPGMLHKHTTWWHRQLNVQQMQAAGQHFLGEQDFSSFRSAECQSKTAKRNVYYLTVKRLGELVIIDICANAFLHHMVRNIAGVLLAIGEGKQPTDWAKQVLQARDREFAGITAPANGLYLVGVDYPKTFKLPKRTAIGPWFCQFVL